MSLYVKHRPIGLADVRGQDLAIKELEGVLNKKEPPRVFLFHGPTGTGKTTLARIVSRMLKVEPIETNPNYVEQNCADCRGIDEVREIAANMSLAPMGGKYRVWVLDEVVQLPTATQQAMLKMLEDTPKHVRFLLCTSNKPKLLDTIVSRCHPIALKSLSLGHLEKVVFSVATAEGQKIDSSVMKKIVTLADGSARQALQDLERVLQFNKTPDQLAILEETAQETVGFQLAQALVYRKGWDKVSAIIRNLGQDPEAVRRVILKYAETIILGADSQVKMRIIASAIISEMRYTFGESGRPGLTSSCWRIVNWK